MLCFQTNFVQSLHEHFSKILIKKNLKLNKNLFNGGVIDVSYKIMYK